MPSTDGMIGATQGILHVAENSLEPLEHFAVVICALIARNDVMIAVRLGDSGKTVQAISDNVTSPPDIFGAPSNDFLLGESLGLV